MRENIHILMIEDDAKIANFMSMALEAKDYKVTIAARGKEGILDFCTLLPDIMILDLGLPDLDGNEIIVKVREISQVPILVVSARGFEEDKIRALDAGANDYITKPFAMGEFLARVRVMERFVSREEQKDREGVYQFDELTVDSLRRRVFLEEKEIHLTPLEYKLLVFLIRNCGKVVTHRQIMKEVWGYSETCEAKSIRVCMASLRRKIEKDTAHPKFILTEIGVGYRFIDK